MDSDGPFSVHMCRKHCSDERGLAYKPYTFRNIWAYHSKFWKKKIMDRINFFIITRIISPAWINFVCEAIE